jgi:molybdopterin/thiamine biosynthesis adenylyltransferase
MNDETSKSQKVEKSKPEASIDRYSRQTILPQIGKTGQQRLRESTVTLVGCGALGTVLADCLVRAGIGRLILIDRDYVELNNLQRQVLFDECDASSGAPKAIAAADRLRKINSDCRIEPIVADAGRRNIESMISDSRLLLDGTDNFQTRFLINDVAVKHRLPWVYGACVGVEGMVMPIIPHTTPCLRCIWGQPPPAGMNPTCDTAGVLGPLVQLVAARQAIEAIKILIGRLDAVQRGLMRIDAWTGETEVYDMQNAMEADCPCCKGSQFEYLEGGLSEAAAALCGRDAVQIGGGTDIQLDFQGIAGRLTGALPKAPMYNQYLLRFEVEGKQVTLFRDGRAIIKGTSEIEEARSLYAKYVGN